MQTRSRILGLLPIFSVVYKIISKILTNKVQGVIGEVANNSQSSFIPDRHIADNILLATALIRGYVRTRVSPRCLMKVDITIKAYDPVEWPFLETLLKELGFHGRFVGWIIVCMRSVSYSILINGMPTELFPAKKGLRQGNPLSPFLFTLCMEYLCRYQKVK